jgi:hypothetical protein
MTCLRWPAWRWALVLAVPALLAACSSGSAPGGSGAPGSSPAAAVVSCASAGGKWTAVKPVSPGTGNNDLTGVAVLAAGNAWAVGTDADVDTNDGRTLIEHWNGTAWSVVPSPDPGVRPDYYSGDFLTAVSASSPSAIWAVGEYESRGRTKTLIVHWNGTAWTRVPSPNPGDPRITGSLHAVAATSAASAWAAGCTSNGPDHQSLILHWNGAAWTQAASPNPGGRGNLAAIAASSPANAWAVGQLLAPGADNPVAVRYCAAPAGKAG